MNSRTRFAAVLTSVTLLAAIGSFACKDPGPIRSRPKTATADNARETKVQAQFSAWNGAHKGLAAFVKRSLDNPESFEHTKTSFDDRVVNLVVTMTYRYADAAGKPQKGSIKAVVDLDGKILEIRSRTP